MVSDREVELAAIVVECVAIDRNTVVKTNGCTAENEESKTDTPVGIGAATKLTRSATDFADIVEQVYQG